MAVLRYLINEAFSHRFGKSGGTFLKYLVRNSQVNRLQMAIRKAILVIILLLIFSNQDDSQE